MARKKREESAQPGPGLPGEVRSGDPLVRRITPIDVQKKEFRVAARPFRGYDEREVDEFLDLVTEELARLHAENRRMQEEIEFRRTVPIDTEGAGGAEVVLQKAREEAARIVAEAEARAFALSSPGGRSGEVQPPAVDMVNRFLARERDFLHGLAGLIQHHTEAVKADARRTREAARAPAPQPADEAQAEDTAAGTPPAEDLDAERSSPRAETQPEGVQPAPPQAREEQELEAPVERGAETPPAEEVSSPTQTWRPLATPQEDQGTWFHAEAPPARVSPQAPAPDEDAGQERSVRELFWGED